MIPTAFSYEKLLSTPRFSLYKELLQQPNAESQNYTEQITDILALLEGTYRSDDGIEAHIVPGEGAELQAITAVILGGTSLFGGQGGLIGTLGGVLLMGLTNNVLVILNVSSWYQELIQGLVIVGAVALFKQKRR